MKLIRLMRLWVVLLITTFSIPVLAQESEWYVELGAGIAASDTLKHSGFNGDNICYPTNSCANEPSGYRWLYDLDADRGGNVEISLGRTFDFHRLHEENSLHWSVGGIPEFQRRLEITLSHTQRDLNQWFVSIQHLDGSALEPAVSDNYSYWDESRVDSVSVSSLELNLYYDLLGLPEWRLDRYFGTGVGLSRVKLSGLYFNSRYECVIEPCDAEYSASTYNSLQDVDLTEIVLHANVSAGINYDISDDVSLGLKLTYAVMGNLKKQAGYINHPIQDLKNTTKISELNGWTATFRLRYYFGR